MIHWKNRGAGLLRCGDKDIKVATIPAAIVDLLLQRPGQAVSTDTLIRHVYGGASEPTDAKGVIQVTISKLRKKGVPIRSNGRGSTDGYWFETDSISFKRGDRYTIDGCPGLFKVKRVIEAPVIVFENDELGMEAMKSADDPILKTLRRVP